MPDSNNWKSFTVRIDVKADMAALYSAWTTRNGMEKWFLRVAAFTDAQGKDRAPEDSIQVGDSYFWLWHGYPDDTEERGNILECNGKDRLVFVFGKAGVCTVSLYQDSGATIVEMRQDQIPDDDTGKMNFYAGCMAGWTFYLANLKSIYEGGIDLRNRNVALKRMVNS